MKSKTISKNDLKLVDMFELWYGSKFVDRFENLDDVKCTMISDVMDRHGYYREPNRDQIHLFADYKIVKIQVVRMPDDIW